MPNKVPAYPVVLPQPVQATYLKHKLFGFVQGDVLKENAALTLQYSSFLLSIEAAFELPGPIRYSLFKNAIIGFASIVEALLVDKLCSLMKAGKVELNLLGEVAEYEEIAKIYRTSKKNIIAVDKKMISKQIGSETKFQEISRAAKRCGLLDDALFKEVEDLRKKRNKIHLAALNEVDDKYDRSDVEKASNILKKVRMRVKNFQKKKK